MTTSNPITGDPAASSQADASTVDGQRADLLTMLGKSRHFLRFTTRDLTDEQARQRTTVSELCLGGLIKHATAVERSWVSLILDESSAMGDFSAMTDDAIAQWVEQFRLLPAETLAGVLDDYAEVARRTDELVATLPDLNTMHSLPKAPWFQPGEQWSTRRVFMHVITETAQHAGHADIIRESLDGAKSMG